jgi:LL-diaminopimelate aminotransferase
MPRLADRMAGLQPYVFQELARRMDLLRSRGADVVDLGISDPDLPPAPEVVATLAAAAAGPANHHYPPYRGAASLRQAVADWYDRRFGVAVDPEREVWIALGSKEALVLLSLAFVNPGEAVLVPDPGYPSYHMAGVLFGARTVRVPLSPAPRFLPCLDRIAPEDAAAARLMYVNYPNNPTGAVADLDQYRSWVTFCAERDAVLVSDLAYADLVYEGRPVSALEVPGARDHTLETITWSKGHSLQGWRVGAVVGGAALIEAVGRVEANINAGVFLAVQAAAAEAIAHDHTAWLRERYRRRRDVVVERLLAAGVAVDRPPAAVYCWLAAPDGDGDGLAARALDNGVAVAPGSAFGPASRDHVRISLTHPDAVLEKGVDRLAAVMAGVRA